MSLMSLRAILGVVGDGGAKGGCIVSSQELICLVTH